MARYIYALNGKSDVQTKRPSKTINKMPLRPIFAEMFDTLKKNEFRWMRMTWHDVGHMLAMNSHPEAIRLLEEEWGQDQNLDWRALSENGSFAAINLIEREVDRRGLGGGGLVVAQGRGKGEESPAGAQDSARQGSQEEKGQQGRGRSRRVAPHGDLLSRRGSSRLWPGAQEAPAS